MQRPWTARYDEGVPHDIDPDALPSTAALLENAVSLFSERPAFECLGATLSYRNLESQSRALAAWLQKQGCVQQGDRVALMCPNLFAFPIAMFATHRIGAIQINVNPLYTPAELRHQLKDSGAETIIIFNGSTPTLAEIIGETQVRNVITIALGDGVGLPLPSPPVDPRLQNVTSYADALKEGATLHFDPPQISNEDILFLQYTGGTTGLSKGAVLTHRNMLAAVAQFSAFYPEATKKGQEILVLALPLYHVFGLAMLFCYLSAGGKGVLIPDPRDEDGLCATLKDSKFTIFAGVNTLYQNLMARPGFKDIDFSAYKIAIGGGAPVIAATSEKWKSFTGKHLKEGYGLSETAALLCLTPMSVSAFTGSCGVPVPSTDLKLVDDDGVEVAPGEAGEICARGPQIMQGYWNKPEENAKSFTDDGYFKTGDIGVLSDDGFLRIVDRKKDLVLVSGFNVYPNEIDAVVNALPGVRNCGCVGVPDAKSGEALRAYIVLEEGASLSAEDIIAHCRKNLAGYKVPRQIAFVDALPMTRLGKILRRDLRDQAKDEGAP